jgi:salicylate hydroxylase
VAGLSITVVGAGIAGLTTALALARQGHTVTILERRTGFSEVGAGLQLSPNASRILLALGLGAALRRVATEPNRVVVRAVGSGREIGRIALGAFMRERFGAPYWVVHRADFQTILLDASRSNPAIRLMMGRTVEDAVTERNAASVTVTTANGAQESFVGDAVIGADGIWSRVRQAVDDGSPPAFLGYIAWRATIPRDQVPPELGLDETGLWLGPQGHVVHYPISGGRLLNIVAITRHPAPVDGWEAPGDGADLLARFTLAAPLLRRLLALPRAWLLRPLYDRPSKQITKDRIALVGDAAHPVLPFLAQGAALAIEDAATLTGLLRQSSGDLPGVLRTYELQRLGRAQKVQRHARRNGWAYHAGGLTAWARNGIMGRLGPEGMTERYSWLYGYGMPDRLAL